MTLTDITSYPTGNLIIKIGVEHYVSPDEDYMFDTYFTFDIPVYTCSDVVIIAPNPIYSYCGVTGYGIDVSDNTVDALFIMLNKFMIEKEEFCGITIEATAVFNQQD